MKIVKHIGAVLAVVLLLAAGLATAGVRVATGQDPGPDDHQVTICHDVEGNGNTGNGYNIITVDKDSIATNPNGHDTHEGDLIPPFAAGFVVGPPPKAWNAYPGKGDFSLIGTNCAAPDTTTTGTTTTTTTETETTTTETTTPPPPPPPPPPPRCPPGEVPTDGKDGEPGNEECEPPGGTTTVETTTTTQPPPTTTGPPTETTAPPETTTTTSQPPAAKPPASKPKPPKQAKPKPPKNAKPKPPPVCPVAQPSTKPCAVQGSG